MYFYKRLYVSPQITDPDQVRRKLVRGQGQLSIWLVTLVENPADRGGDQMEIMHSANLKQPWYRQHPPMILGLANGRDDAVALVQQILEEAMLAVGEADVHKYLFTRGIQKKQG